MEKKIALVGIIVQDPNAVSEVNRVLHEYAHCVVGRMGIPRPENGMNIISVVLEATPNEINAMSGKLGRMKGVLAKSIQTDKVVGEPK